MKKSGRFGLEVGQMCDIIYCEVVGTCVILIRCAIFIVLDFDCICMTISGTYTHGEEV
jgi:hypothetical protein